MMVHILETIRRSGLAVLLTLMIASAGVAMTSQVADEPMKQKQSPAKDGATVIDLGRAKVVGFLITFERGNPDDVARREHERQVLQGKVTIPANHQVFLFVEAPDRRAPTPA
jgi:hypothetical protein